MVYNIIDFGAKSGAGLCTKEVQAAIDACRIEHVISQESFECLCNAVNNK